MTRSQDIEFYCLKWDRLIYDLLKRLPLIKPALFLLKRILILFIVLVGTVQAVEKSIDISLSVEPHKWTGVRLKNLQKGTLLKTALTIDKEAQIFLLDNSQYSTFPGLIKEPLFHAKTQDKLEFTVTVPVSDNYVLIIDNRDGNEKRTFSLNLKASLDITAGSKNPVEVNNENTRKLTQQLEVFSDSLKKAFIFDDIDFQVVKCGRINVYSNASTVFLCAEYFAAIYLKKKDIKQFQNVLLFTLMHEVGHILLKKWNYPLADNEEAVDEFATMVLMMFNKQETALAQADFFAAVSPQAEIAKKSDKDDRHPLSVQRARNIRRWLSSPDLVKQWQPILIPKMQTAFLKVLSGKSLSWINHELVNKELAQRTS